ncbi:thiamine pyrophosphate-dependent enzyme [Methanospirillum sp.]|uniref:thiamine pyrophosphate-dependent enzyme n=1 Tax=Methanospirillum sp. TaxID=45200 RepID=UPI00359FC20E
MNFSPGKAVLEYADTIYAVPGYPVNTLIEETRAELVINEKVALEYALGDSLSGKRSCVIVKHVGMNVLADPLVHATSQGLRAGVVIIAGDDPNAFGSQTVQDSRLYGPIAVCPVIDVNNPDPVGEAFYASERFSRVSIVRFVPDDLKKPWKRVPEPYYERRSGQLADQDLTMYGRAVSAYSAIPDMTKAGYLPFPVPPLIRDGSHVSRSERGSSRTLCPGCPFRFVFDILQEKGIRVISDTGCSLLAMISPYTCGIANYGMGSSVGVAAHATGVALTGDYALIHSGVQALIDLHAKGRPVLVIVLQNRCMGTTGRQPVPDICTYLGFADPIVCDACEHEKISGMMIPGENFRVLIIQGECPEK